MLADAATAASDLLWSNWQAGGVIDELPEALRPGSRADGYAIQAHLERRTARPIAGWKIAATSKAGQQHINVDGPLAGRLLAERTFADGARLAFGANRMRVAETEFAFRMGRDLPPRQAPYGVDEVIAAVASLHPALEIPDSRYSDFTKVGASQLIADNACAHQVVFGAPATADWRSLDLAKHQVHGSVAGKLERDGIGANVLGDPRLALAWLANELSAHRITLHAGQTVITGTCMAPLPIEPMDRVSADYGLLGRISIEIVR